MRKAIVLLVAALILALVFTVMLTAVAWAASPHDIYQDYANNHSKQNIEKYPTAELQAYLGDAAIAMYENGENPSIVTDLNALVTGILSQRSPGGHSTFPFGLICGGYVLRRATSRA
jgi:hypothetical protein